MSALAVLDAYSLQSLSMTTVPAPGCNPLYNALTVEVQTARLTFSDLTLKECKKYAPGETATMWATAVAGHRTDCKPDYSFLELVLQGARTLLDEDDEDDQPQPEVAALALYKVDAGYDVVVVSEDLVDLPNRSCLHSACPSLALPVCRLRDYLINLGLGQYLT